MSEEKWVYDVHAQVDREFRAEGGRHYWELSEEEKKLPDEYREMLLQWRRGCLVSGEDPFSRTIVVDSSGDWHWEETDNFETFAKEVLKEFGERVIFSVPVKKIEEIMPEVFDYIKEKFREFTEDEFNNGTSVEDYRNWRKYGTVEMVLENGELSYTPVWPKKELPGNDLPWGYDKIDDIELDALEEIAKYWVE